MNSSHTITSTSTSTSSPSIEMLIQRAFGTNILELEDTEITPFTERDVFNIKSNTPSGRRIRRDFREELLISRQQEVEHYTRVILLKRETGYASKGTLFKEGIKLSISVSKAKAGAFTHILNGNGEGARASLNRMKEKYGIMMENTLEQEEGILSIIDVEHPNQRTSRDYTGGKQTENARQLGKSIMGNINYIENGIKIFC